MAIRQREQETSKPAPKGLGLVGAPVIFIELYAHSGIFLSSDDPEPFHIHNIIRSPNGNDYGRAHLQQFQERSGEHA